MMHNDDITDSCNVPLKKYSFEVRTKNAYDYVETLITNMNMLYNTVNATHGGYCRFNVWTNYDKKELEQLCNPMCYAWKSHHIYNT